MGYEIKLLIGRVHGSWFSTIAMVDLRKPDYDSQIYKLSRDGEGISIELANLDGDSIGEDKYGNQLLAKDMQGTINALKRDVAGSEYPPFKIALTTLREIQRFYPYAKIVLFGY